MLNNNINGRSKMKDATFLAVLMVQLSVQVCWFIYCIFQKKWSKHFSQCEWSCPFLNWLETDISLNLLISIEVLLQLNYWQLILKMNFRLLLCVHWSAVINKQNCLEVKRFPWDVKSRAPSCLRTLRDTQMTHTHFLKMFSQETSGIWGLLQENTHCRYM